MPVLSLDCQVLLRLHRRARVDTSDDQAQAAITPKILSFLN
jgi:hypothetical protein